MPFRSTVITPFHRYYGLLPPDCNGHFLPLSFISTYLPSLSEFRCSLCLSLIYAALAPISDPPVALLPRVGGLRAPFVTLRMGQSPKAAI